MKCSKAQFVVSDHQETTATYSEYKPLFWLKYLKF